MILLSIPWAVNDCLHNLAPAALPLPTGRKPWTRTRVRRRVTSLPEEYSGGNNLHPVLASSTEQGARKNKLWRIHSF